MKVETDTLGTTADGEPVSKFTLTNSHGHRVALMNWGASILEVEVPDREGKLANVNCVFDSLEPYLSKHPYFGSTVGRFCNRIAGARFEIDGHEYSLTANHGRHQLHGGITNFAFQNWHSETVDQAGSVGVNFQWLSPDGHEGFPGTLRVTTEYRWNDASELSIKFTATTDAATHVNMTNHSYWNLAGVGEGAILDHQLQIHADQVLEVTDELIPTGGLVDVQRTPFDFRQPTAIGDGNDQLFASRGYDHCFVLSGDAGRLRMAARATDPQSGRVLEVETTQPGMQLYAAGNLPGGSASAGNGPHDAFCFETQHFPDSPHHAHFPSTLLRPGETFAETTVYRFSTDQAGH